MRSSWSLLGNCFRCNQSIQAKICTATSWQSACQTGRCDNDCTLRLRQYQCQALLRMSRIEWNISATDFEDREQRDQHLKRAFLVNTHDPFGPNTLAQQMV